MSLIANYKLPPHIAALVVGFDDNKNYILAGRVNPPDMKAHAGFQWPEMGRVVCPTACISEDCQRRGRCRCVWKLTNDCGNGLHAWEFGVGELATDHWKQTGCQWLILVVEDSPENLERIDGKIKFNLGDVIFKGDQNAYIKQLRELGVNIPGMVGNASTAGSEGAASSGPLGSATAGKGGSATAGDSGSATAGKGGSATAGDSGSATAGFRGSATAGFRGSATAGFRGSATAGDSGSATAGDSGSATAGFRGSATAGKGGSATAGDSGSATAGCRGSATAGFRGSATAGKGGVISISWWDGDSSEYMLEPARVGRDLDAAGRIILSERPYRLNAEHKFERVSGKDRIQIEMGNIIDQAVHVIVNAANETLLGGGGVDGAIHEAAGPELLEACKKLKGAKAGEVKLTPAFRLAARFIAHAVGPRWNGGDQGEAETLMAVYKNAIAAGREKGAITFAFPSISTGAFGYPLALAAPIAVSTLAAAIEETPIAFVRIVCFDDTTYKAYQAALATP